MDEESYDPCECVWSHDAVQRLLSLLRQTQATCTENECYPTTRLPSPLSGQASQDMFFMTMIFGILALLYFFRPKSLRQTSYDDVKSRDNSPGSSGDPPRPPPTAN